MALTYLQDLHTAQEELEKAEHVYKVALADLREIARDKNVPDAEYLRRLAIVGDTFAKVLKTRETYDRIAGRSRISTVWRKKKDSA